MLFPALSTTTLVTDEIRGLVEDQGKEGNVLFNTALNTFSYKHMSSVARDDL